MKKVILYVAAGLLIVGGQVLMADDSTTSTNTTSQTTPGGKHAAMSEEDRKKAMAAILKDVGLTQADLADLSPKDRAAKVNTAVKAKITDLQAKKTAGTLSAEEKKELSQLTKFQDHRAAHKKATDAAAAGQTSTTPAPAQ